MIASDIELVLDLREHDSFIRGAEEVSALWATVEPALRGRVLLPDSRHELEDDKGVVALQVMRTTTTRPVDDRTVFSIVAIREAPRLLYKCSGPHDVSAYGPFTCAACKAAERPDRLCDLHVDILDGDLITTCAEHRPACSDCGARADFRCSGRGCDRTRAPHCAAHGRTHPTDPDVRYCLRCYDREFPQCAAAGCTKIAHIMCEHVDAAGSSCGSHACPAHARRWQVYGPVGLGLALCPQHSVVRNLSGPEIVRQIVLATARRTRGRKSGRPGEYLPSLKSFQYSLRKAGIGQVSLPAIKHDAEDLARQARADVEVRTAIGAARAGWENEIAKAREDDGRMQELFARLTVLVRTSGVYQRDPEQFARALTPLQFVRGKMRRDGTRSPDALYVDLPEDLRGRFLGTARANVNRLGQALGVDVRLPSRGTR